MPGGSKEAWGAIKPIFQSIAAKVEDGSPCCDWVGSDGAGHFVKMVHNGIEYGDMQIISESYHLMKAYLGLSADEMHAVYDDWNQGDLDSYLIEITRDIMAYKDADGQPLLDKILDKAGQKGTGKWTSEAALDHGIPLTLISEAVFARAISAQKDERTAAAKRLTGSKPVLTGTSRCSLNSSGQSVYAAKIISYAQGYALLKAAADAYGWQLNYGGIALMWRGGCIIRSAFLGKIKEAFDANPDLTNLLLDPYFREKVQSAIPGLREVVSAAVLNGIPVPTLSAALTYFDSYRSAWLPANLLQAQRDYFGAHTYERTDKPRGEFFHTNWTGTGGDTTSNTYNA